MIEGTSLSGQPLAPAQNLSAPQKAQVIYAQAQSEVTGKLWRAALGNVDQGGAAHSPDSTEKLASPFSMEALLELLEQRTAGSAREGGLPAPVPMDSGKGGFGPNQDRQSGAPRGLEAESDAGSNLTQMAAGANGRYVGVVAQAASRTGIPASALSTIVDAEAAKGSDGRWLPYSRNPRSSAAGLGQFLNKTWVGEAERKGTWLNNMAEQNGWLNSRGDVRGESKAALLALRYDPQASIEATADYAKSNLETLRRSGVRTGDSVTQLAQSAYLAHHLGIGDAVKFLTGGLSASRARTLLNAQVGASSANQRIELAGNAVAAHRDWLMDYVDRRIKPNKFG